MQFTRRQFFALSALTAALYGCGNNAQPQEPTTESDSETSLPAGWRTVVIDNISIGVPEGFDFTTEETFDDGSELYWLSEDGGDYSLNVNVSDGDSEITGNFEVTEISGNKIYYTVFDEQTATIRFNVDDKSFELVLVGDPDKIEERMQQTIQSLSF